MPDFSKFTDAAKSTYADGKNILNNFGKALNGEAPKHTQYDKNDFIEVLTCLRDGKAVPPQLKDLAKKTREHTLRNLEKVGHDGVAGKSAEILPGQFKTGFRQVNVVESDNFVKPKDWRFEEKDGDFAKGIYADSLAHMDTAEDKMPANCDILTLDNVCNSRAPNAGKPWNPEIPLYGTDGANNNVVVLLPEHPKTEEIFATLHKTHYSPDDCGKDSEAGARAAMLSALMQMNNAKLKGHLDKLHCDVNLRESLVKFHNEHSQSGNFNAVLAELAATGINHGHPKYPEYKEVLEAITAVTTEILGPLNNLKQKQGNFSNSKKTDNTKILFLLNHFEVTGLIHGNSHAGANGQPGRNLMVSSKELASNAGLFASTDTASHLRGVEQFTADVPIIVDNGKGAYSISFTKPVMKEDKPSGQGEPNMQSPDGEEKADGAPTPAQASDKTSKANQERNVRMEAGDDPRNQKTQAPSADGVDKRLLPKEQEKAKREAAMGPPNLEPKSTQTSATQSPASDTTYATPTESASSSNAPLGGVAESISKMISI